ncbi:Uma2 family endonuclease [Anabaena cylindrica UHCC 0172]|uniref:Uma2 family endonuclease n=1 Tax=Anabaena cylindrica TaxID=1165 RepID=UPI002B20AEDE|nr:Uma2 family endonuclease [Anabaena cylindrica]MEA5554374.1 Uma2 family endonuclease [Anabaena cylindrica UHCC 0172]
MSISQDFELPQDLIVPTGDLYSDEPPLDFELPRDVIFPTKDLKSNEPPLESDSHLRQIILLLQCLELWWGNRNDFYASGNSTVYYSSRQPKSEDFRGPDFFVVRNAERHPRNSWVVWQEDGKYPNIIIELLSDASVSIDKGLKKQIYQDIFRTPEYFWFDPNNLEFAGFILVGGTYQPLEPNNQGWLWSQQLSLYLGIHENKLRYFTNEGLIILTPEEFAEQEKQKSERLAAKLRELGIDPDTI